MKSDRLKTLLINKNTFEFIGCCLFCVQQTTQKQKFRYLFENAMKYLLLYTTNAVGHLKSSIIQIIRFCPAQTGFGECTKW